MVSVVFDPVIRAGIGTGPDINDYDTRLRGEGLVGQAVAWLNRGNILIWSELLIFMTQFR